MIYKPSELYFDIEKEEYDFRMSDGPIVFIGIKDDPGAYTGGHNIDKNVLNSCGVNDCELMEGYFEILPGFTEEQVKDLLINQGFEYRHDEIGMF